MTINEAIVVLQTMREKSILGGETVLVVSLTDSEIEEVAVETLVLQQTGSEVDGALVLVTAHLPSKRSGEIAQGPHGLTIKYPWEKS